jgi:serine/threonine protein kinase
MNFEKIKIIKDLGKGLYGNVYLVKIDNNIYALKRQKIVKEAIKKNYKYEIWKEIDFYKWINKLNKTDQIFFMKLYDYQIVKCNYVHKPEKIIDLQLYNKLKKSPYCIDLLFDVKDTTLRELINKNDLDYKERLSIIIQCLYTMYLMHQSNYYHNDTHTGNIMITECDYNKVIKLNINKKTYNLKTFGYIVSFIDYGSINHPKYLLNKKDKTNYLFNKNHNIDLFIFIDTCLINDENNVYSHIKSTKYNPYLFLRKLYNDEYLQYLLIKNQYLGLWNNDDIILWFEQFENDKLSKNKYFYKGIVYELLQILCIDSRKVFCELLNIPYFELFIDDDIAKLIKLNLYNENKTIIELLKYI